MLAGGVFLDIGNGPQSPAVNMELQRQWVSDHGQFVVEWWAMVEPIPLMVCGIG